MEFEEFLNDLKELSETEEETLPVYSQRLSDYISGYETVTIFPRLKRFSDWVAIEDNQMSFDQLEKVVEIFTDVKSQAKILKTWLRKNDFKSFDQNQFRQSFSEIISSQNEENYANEIEIFLLLKSDLNLQDKYQNLLSLIESKPQNKKIFDDRDFLQIFAQMFGNKKVLELVTDLYPEDEELRINVFKEVAHKSKLEANFKNFFKEFVATVSDKNAIDLTIIFYSHFTLRDQLEIFNKRINPKYSFLKDALERVSLQDILKPQFLEIVKENTELESLEGFTALGIFSYLDNPRGDLGVFQNLRECFKPEFYDVLCEEYAAELVGKTRVSIDRNEIEPM